MRTGSAGRNLRTCRRLTSPSAPFWNSLRHGCSNRASSVSSSFPSWPSLGGCLAPSGNACVIGGDPCEGERARNSRDMPAPRSTLPKNATRCASRNRRNAVYPIPPPVPLCDPVTENVSSDYGVGVRSGVEISMTYPASSIRSTTSCSGCRRSSLRRGARNGTSRGLPSSVIFIRSSPAFP